MQAVLDLLKSKKISFSNLITHTFELANATDAYNIILSKQEPFLGILIEYDKLEKPEKKILLNQSENNPISPNAGMIGAGAFAQNILLPILKKNVNLVGISTSHGNSSVYTGRKYNFKYAATQPDEIYNDPEINTVFILTRHNLHASQTILALKAGKNVFVVLFKRGKSGWIEFICPDKASFSKNFNLDQSKLEYYTTFETWEPLKRMASYNKFAVAASDLTGKWASWSGSNVQYVNAYTGLDAGMGHAQSGNEIVFNANGTYNREYKGVSGSPGGGNKYYGEKNNGNAIVGNWEVQLTNSFKGETHVFAAQFEAVKGGRILHLYRGNIEEMHLYKVN
jgi:hypothetical protein